MPKKDEAQVNLSALLKRSSIMFSSQEHRDAVKLSPTILNLKFEIKAYEEKRQTQKIVTYYLFCNGVLITTAGGVDQEEFAAKEFNFIKENFGSELITSALDILRLASLAAGSKVNIPHKKLYRQVFKFGNQRVAREGVKRRNLQVGIKSGRPKDSRKKAVRYTQPKLYSELRRHVRSYYEREGKEPTQSEMAVELGLGYGKRLYRELKRFGEVKDWHELVNCLLAREI